VPPEIQAGDAFNAAAYLRSLSKVAADRVGVVGFSHGGWAVLKAVLDETVVPGKVTPFAAAIAFYPGCDAPTSALETDTLILIGEADDWTPMRRCKRWVEEVQTKGHVAHLRSYPGALHGFDAPASPHMYAGHYVGRDAEAAQSASAEAHAFLDGRLMR